MAGERICLGVIGAPHGVRGLVKVKSFTEVPQDLVAYGPLADKTGKRPFALTLKGEVKGLLLVQIAGVDDRDQAQALRGTELYVARAALPAPADEDYYHADLVGLAVEDRSGKGLGRVTAVEDHGGGAYLEVTGSDGDALFLPFTRAAVPEIDLAGGRIVADPPAEILVRPAGPGGEEVGEEDL